jgi:hypothetical protein
MTSRPPRSRSRARSSAIVRDRVGRASVALVDSALASPYADVVVGQVLASGVAERAIERALSGELVDVVANDLIRYEVVERVTEQMLAGGVADRALDRATATGVPERLAERMLAQGIADQIATRLLAGPELERIVERALESPGMERVVDRIVESRLIEQTITRVVDDVVGDLPSSEAMWALIDVIAQSPAVTDAITSRAPASPIRWRGRCASARVPSTHGSSAARGGCCAGARAPRLRAARCLRRRTRHDRVARAGAACGGERDRVRLRRARHAHRGLRSRRRDHRRGRGGGGRGVRARAVAVQPPQRVERWQVAAGGVAAVIWSISYFTFFWSTTGRRRGTASCRIEVRGVQGERLSVRRAFVRCAPCCRCR